MSMRRWRWRSAAAGWRRRRRSLAPCSTTGTARGDRADRGSCAAWKGSKRSRRGRATNYPVTLSIDDLGDGFLLTAQAVAPIEPRRVCEYMRTALEGLVEALESAPETPERDRGAAGS